MTYNKIQDNELFISLGSNLGDRKKNILSAIALLEHSLQEKIIISPFYESKALGFESERNFLNICAKTKADIQPIKILNKIHSIEKELGRVRTDNSGYKDRLIDIDILFYGQNIIKTKKIKVPHPKIYERKFVLIPLQDIAKNLLDPLTGKDVITLIKSCNDQSNLILYEK
jgi:2-amino-4-hydroxy-6-hydroxymethyldihydropteridine diphosphokinase